MTPDAARDLSRYRPNVGVVLFHPDGRVWLGRRRRTPGPYNWQFPQGGVDDGEDLEAAARRELREETGVHSATRLARTDDWIAYDFPSGPGCAPPNARERGFAGQRQIWFAFRFEGEETEIDLSAFPIEFDAWRWATLDEALQQIVPFKRATYAEVARVFRPFAEAA